MRITDFLNLFASTNFISAGIILLLFNKKRSFFRKLLGFYTLIVGTTILIISFYNFPNPILNHLFGYELFTGSFQGPVFILLTKNVINKKLQFSLSNILLFVYPLIVLIVLIYQHLIPGYQTSFLKEVQAGESKIGQAIGGINYLYILVSVIYGTLILRKKHVFSNIFYSRFEIIRIKWLCRFFMLHVITAPFAAIAFYALAIKGSGSYFGFLASVIYLYFIYKLITEPGLAYHSNEKRNNEDNPDINKSEKDILLILRETLTKEKLFLSKEITLYDLSKKIAITPDQIETSLARVEAKTFKELINSFRLGHARELLGDNKYNKYTIDYIADLCGFSSRTTFYELFKKEFRSTPLQYRKSCLENIPHNSPFNKY